MISRRCKGCYKWSKCILPRNDGICEHTVCLSTWLGSWVWNSSHHVFTDTDAVSAKNKVSLESAQLLVTSSKYLYSFLATVRSGLSFHASKIWFSASQFSLQSWLSYSNIDQTQLWLGVAFWKKSWVEINFCCLCCFLGNHVDRRNIKMLVVGKYW